MGAQAAPVKFRCATGSCGHPLAPTAPVIYLLALRRRLSTGWHCLGGSMLKFWTSPRIGRGDFFFALVGLNAAYLAAQYWLFGVIDLMLQFGFRSDPWTLPMQPPSLIALRAAFDAALLWCIARRLRDAGLSGWIALAALALPLALGGVGALVTMIGMIVLFFVPGTIGPNRFGPDPRGWKSREHFEEQRRRLSAGDV